MDFMLTGLLHFFLDLSALIFLYTAAAKLTSVETFRNGLLLLPGMNGTAAALISWTIPISESILSVLIFLNLDIGKLFGIAALFMFSLVALIAVRSGRSIPCGCFGGDGDILSLRTVARNFLLMAALGTTFLLSERTLWLSSILVSLSGLLLAATLWSLIGNARSIRALSAGGFL